MVEEYPDRLRGMAHLPMQEPDAAITELERAVKEHKFKAVELGTSIEGTPLADMKFRKVLKTIEQLGLFIFTHPYQCLAQGGMDDYYLRNFIGFRSTRHMGRISCQRRDGRPKKCASVAHGGGFMPYQIGRFRPRHDVRPEPRSTPEPPANLFSAFTSIA